MRAARDDCEQSASSQQQRPARYAHRTRMSGGGRIAVGLGVTFTATFLLARALGWLDETAVREALDAVARERGAMLAALAIVGLLAADLVLPVPGSVVMTMAGYLLGVPGALASFAGAMLAAAVGFELARAGRRARWRCFDAATTTQLTAIFATWGRWVLLLSRAVPMAAEVVSCLAGASAMPRLRFYALAAAGAAPLCGVHAWAGSSARGGTSAIAVAAALAGPALGLAAWSLLLATPQSPARRGLR